MATNVPNPGNYQDTIAIMLVTIRNTFGQLVDQKDYINSMGGETFLMAAYPDGLGMSKTDADALIATLNQHADLNTGYIGGTPAPQLNYRQNGSQFWGGH
jgi:hypothetical protein